MLTYLVGLHNAQGPPVPIPNTEVKLCGAENTRREAVREDRARPTFSYSSLAQSVVRTSFMLIGNVAKGKQKNGSSFCELRHIPR